MRVKPETEIAADTGYQGIVGLHANSVPPKKKTKKNPLTKGDKAFNCAVSSRRVVNEQVIGCIALPHWFWIHTATAVKILACTLILLPLFITLT